MDAGIRRQRVIRRNRLRDREGAQCHGVLAGALFCATGEWGAVKWTGQSGLSGAICRIET